MGTATGGSHTADLLIRNHLSCAWSELAAGSGYSPRFSNSESPVDVRFPAVRSRWGHHPLLPLTAVSPMGSGFLAWQSMT